MKCYILSRKDLAPSYIAVQSCHAAAGLCMEHRDNPLVNEWYKNHLTMILLGVKDEKELFFWKRRLEQEGIVNHMFIEPDIGDRPTSLACCPREDQEHMFSSLRLLKVSTEPSQLVVV